MEALIGNTITRVLADRGYRGHNAPPQYRFRIFIQGQKRRVTPKIKREMRRRSAIEPVIGHTKAEHRMGYRTPCRMAERSRIAAPYSASSASIISETNRSPL